MPASGRLLGSASAVDPGGMPSTAGISCFSGSPAGTGTTAVVVVDVSVGPPAMSLVRPALAGRVLMPAVEMLN